MLSLKHSGEKLTEENAVGENQLETNRLERKIGPSGRRFPPCSLYLISSWADSETRHASTLRGKSKWKKRERKKEERKNLTRVDFYILVSKGLPVCLLKRK